MKRILKLTVLVALLAWTKAVWADEPGSTSNDVEEMTSDVGFVVRAFAATRRVYPDAYAFQERVYQGCMH